MDKLQYDHDFWWGKLEDLSNRLVPCKRVALWRERRRGVPGDLGVRVGTRFLGVWGCGVAMSGEEKVRIFCRSFLKGKHDRQMWRDRFCLQYGTNGSSGELRRREDIYE
ncbi:hypothetical protein C8J57DRAFT_1246984 [Mycena rebaudengoi]|nr:hypothetical protein C8J57DRAFT_1246984 [Mycena rebaudengoi]